MKIKKNLKTNRMIQNIGCKIVQKTFCFGIQLILETGYPFARLYFPAIFYVALKRYFRFSEYLIVPAAGREGRNKGCCRNKEIRSRRSTFGANVSSCILE